MDRHAGRFARSIPHGDIDVRPKRVDRRAVPGETWQLVPKPFAVSDIHSNESITERRSERVDRRCAATAAVTDVCVAFYASVR